MGDNIRIVCKKNGLYTADIEQLSIREIHGKMFVNFRNQENHNLERTGAHIRELVGFRESIDYLFLDKSEINDMINFVCTDIMP